METSEANNRSFPADTGAKLFACFLFPFQLYTPTYDNNIRKKSNRNGHYIKRAKTLHKNCFRLNCVTLREMSKLNIDPDNKDKSGKFPQARSPFKFLLLSDLLIGNSKSALRQSNCLRQSVWLLCAVEMMTPKTGMSGEREIRLENCSWRPSARPPTGIRL
jgi:hypothetical protein